ncbi:RluA family pseudouridine synthase [Leptothrix ochracea]|uniref:RluA family pseudouridine synthase n=1 Tax=Leptothrix ochracea TaxID=735331 RepID=UPI0034E261BC
MTVELSYLHVDESLLVIDKPSGLLAVPGRGEDKQDCALTRVQLRFPEALVVHRLDQPTSGLMMLARNLETQRRLSTAFAERQVRKVYHAVVAGRPAGISGTVNLPLCCDWPHRPKQMVNWEHGKPSVTHWRALGPHAQIEDSICMELRPVTGRSHQLRVHMQALGHPILGDGLYAPEEIQQKASRLLLHATLLEVIHPSSGEKLVIHSLSPFFDQTGLGCC